MSASYFQQVAKKFETLLETALNELTTEQNKRKESENKLLELELSLVNKDHQLKILEARLEDTKREKDEKISNLESSINFLQSSIIEKEQEILRLQEFAEESEGPAMGGQSPNMSQAVEKFEQTLNKLLENSVESRDENDFSPHDSHIARNSTFIDEEADVMNVDETQDSPDDNGEDEEYILDESLEELHNEDNNIEDITEAVDIKEDFTLPSIPVSSSSKKVTDHNSGKDCQTCGEIFPTKSLLKEHQKELDHLPRFECDVCYKTFKTKGTCQAHKLRIHSDVMPFKCNKCEKRFKDAGSCRRHEANDKVHIRNENIKQNPNLMCNICGKEFDRNRRWCLDQHYLSHLSSKGRFLNLSEKTKKFKSEKS